MKKFLLFVLLAFNGSFLMAQTLSPEQFLGYPLGKKYTPHHRVVAYFQHVAAGNPSTVKLTQYGQTNEGRPLMLAYIATPENLKRLEDIRTSNLSLAESGAQKGSQPAIVWLSYNVHGNETSSSEASMLTLWELVNPANKQTKEWLQKLLVVMDPCINPDGRDRYVNWFNSVVGDQASPLSFTREHTEPWPGGRSNHYNFDLNRDWAWQTQVESQQRMAQYNKWLPQVHVDFHEQGVNEPYYFAPAAEPYHEIITPWQRKFQELIGKSNAKYFDSNGWLFFTKERFDLFYPSYGDTYPIYKGAIGMTFEQGGGGRGGAAIINEDGDTLTLKDRLTHHFTTGLSTIQTSAENADRLINEFKAYYEKARSGVVCDFKNYILKADEGDRLARLKQLFAQNQIEWSFCKPATYSGLNYISGKTESFKTTAFDIVVSGAQQNASLVRLLLERNSRISDSATYDITAWSLPFAYGVTAFGVNTPVTTNTIVAIDEPQATMPAIEETTPAVAIEWKGLQSAQVLAQLLKSGIRVRYAEQPFRSGNRDYEKGTLLITKTSNSRWGNTLFEKVWKIAKNQGLQIYPIGSGLVDRGFDLGSDKVRIINAPRVTLLAGDGVSSLGMGEVWHFMERQLGYPVNLVWTNNLNKDVLLKTDVLVMPDGNYKFLSDKSFSEDLKEWVSKGGRIIALENAAINLARNDWGFKLKTEEKSDKKDNPSSFVLNRYENRERDELKSSNPGSIFKVKLDNSHPLAFGYSDEYYTLKQDANLFEYMKDGGWNVGTMGKDAHIAGFVGVEAKPKLQEGLVLGVKELGRGSVVIFGDDVLFRNFWENGKLLFCNALFMVGQ